MLHVKNLTKIFHNKKVLNNISFSAQRGSITLFLGASGVGKSTLLRVLNNLETMDEGAVFLDDKLLDISHVNKSHTIGMVFQHFNLFPHLTVLDNITLALIHTQNMSKQAAEKIAYHLLEQYGLDDKKNSSIAQLSGGQKQRLALIRMLALKPKVICLDEPTSALDPLLTTYVASTIQQLAHEGIIVLVATHDVVLIEKLQCTINLMHAGSIIETASSADYLRQPRSYPALHAFVTGNVHKT